MSVSILIGDCRLRMKELADNSVDSVVCDPPYHLTTPGSRAVRSNLEQPSDKDLTAINAGAFRRLAKGFMGQKWDGGDIAQDHAMWAEVLRVLKPGGHLVAFSGTRTYHRMAVAIEDAGFEIRDQLAWVYGSGFPKSLDVSKQLDKMVGAVREVIGSKGLNRFNGTRADKNKGKYGKDHRTFEEADALTAPATEAAQQWQGWGTALKPSWETIALAQKPYDFRQLCGILARNISEAVCQLPSLAKDAGPSSWLSQSVFVEGFGSAQWSAVAECNTPDALFDLMATLPSASALPSSLSTAFSWLNTLAAVSTLGSTFTTETVTSLTTDLRTLSSLLSKNTPATIALAAIPQSGTPSAASLAASLFSAVELRLRLTQGLSALDRATLKDLESCQGADVSPNLEPICLARKPLESTVAANVLEHGTGALNIDGCRIEGEKGWPDTRRYAPGQLAGGCGDLRGETVEAENKNPAARWPANLCHDGSEEVLAGFPETNSGGDLNRINSGIWNQPYSRDNIGFKRDEGSAARFFYCAKAASDERGDGNNHPTVKPIALMRWLCRLVTPPGGTILDPFMGSGSTLIAADAEQFHAIGCELSPEYAAIAERRIRDAAGMFADVKVAA